MNITTQEVLTLLDGVQFKVVGPFLVADLSRKKKLYNRLPVGEYGMEQVCEKQKTESHTHDFVSLYKSDALDVTSGSKRFALPKKALTIVLPGVAHSWVAKKEKGAVGSVDHRHSAQVVQKLVTA